MPTNLKFRSYLEYELKALYLYNNDGATALPDRTKFYALVGNANISDISTKAEIIAAEQIASNANTYERFNLLFSNPIYDATNKRWQLPIKTWTLTVGEEIDYNFIALLADARPQSNLQCTATTGTPGTIETITAHGLSANEEVMIVGATQPGGVSATTIYYAEIVSPNEIQLKTSPTAAAIAINSAGSDLQLKYAAGEIVGFRKEDATETLAANTPISWNFTLTNAAYFGIGQGS